MAIRKQSLLRWALWLTLAAAVAAGIVYVLIWWGPDAIAGHDIGNVTGSLRALHLQQDRDTARGQLLTLGAGIFAAAALVYTARNSTFARRTVELVEQGHVTDRYTKAIEQLGSDKLDVRLGGIYALERIAQDSPRDQPTVMEVLAAFIREHSCEPWSAPQLPDTPTPKHTMRPDVQAALTVIGRRDATHDRQSIDLNATDLRCADLNFAQLSGAFLARANLSGAGLQHASLDHAKMGLANLSGALLTSVNLTGAGLPAANFARADLSNANLNGALLHSANLTDASVVFADLRGAELTHADLTGAFLSGADFAGANLDGVLWPPDVSVPSGWQRDVNSEHLIREHGSSSDETTIK
jgi:Pentapeptide repeats (8 copies)